MSNYVRAKVIRMKITKEQYNNEKYFKEIYGYLFGDYKKDKNYFELECSDNDYYLDFVLYYTYGEEIGSFGNVRLLTNKEFEFIKQLFQKVNPEIKLEDLRYVDYCYYNCCECEDYFDIIEEDIFKGCDINEIRI